MKITFLRRKTKGYGLFARAIGLVTASLLLGAGTFASADSLHKKTHNFEFTNVVDSTQGYSKFETFPAINNQGGVVFVAVKGGDQGVFVARNGAVTTIASEASGLHFFGIDPAINASGVVAFGATTPANTRAIFTGTGGPLTLIVDSLASGLVKNVVGSPSINAAGTVAFSAVRNERGLPSSIYSVTGGPLTTLLNTASTGFRAFGNVDINDAGKIVFHGFLQDGNEGIFIGTSSPAVVVSTATNPELANGFNDAVINNGGTVAIIGFRSAGGIQVLTGNTRQLTPRNNPAQPAFTLAEHPSLNNRGAVAFYAFPAGDPSEPTGIFLEASGGTSLIPVVRPGDRLFGSTVVSVGLGRFGLNDRFELAFQYVLEDGRSGIAIAAYNGENEQNDDRQN